MRNRHMMNEMCSCKDLRPKEPKIRGVLKEKLEQYDVTFESLYQTFGEGPLR